MRTGPCANAGVVKINGREVGWLGKVEDEVVFLGARIKLPKLRTTLTDAKGGHCYRQHEAIYADRPATVDRPADAVFKGARVYAVAPVNVFLKSAPHKLTVSAAKGDDATQVRSLSELDRCK